MRKITTALPLGLAGLALLAPTAHGGTQVVSNPAPGVTSVSVSDEIENGMVVIRATTPVEATHFSAMFFDVDGSGESDVAILAVAASGDASVRVRSTPDSSTSCQQFGGTSASAISNATATLSTDDSGWVVRVPVSDLPGSFDWQITATAPTDEEWCGSTDGAADGWATALDHTEQFEAGTPNPPVDTTAPDAPTDLTAVAGDKSAAIDWADSAASDLDRYLVYRRAVGGAFTLVAEPGASLLADNGLANGTTYEYYVKAQDISGNLSAESGRVTVNPSAPVTPPPVVTVPQPPVTPVTPVTPPPAGAKELGAIGSLQLLDTKTAKSAPKFDAKTGKVAMGVLYNGATVPSTITMRFTVPVKVKGSNKTKLVVVGSATITLKPGQALPLTFKLNRAGRALAKASAKLRISAAVTIKPQGQATSKGTLKLTVKKAPKKNRA